MAAPYSTAQFVLSVGSTQFACGTSATLSLGTDTIDASNKSDGAWQKQFPGKLTWSMSGDALMESDMVSTVTAGQLVNVSFSGGGFYASGQALISSYEISSSAGDIAKVSITCDGSGELTILKTAQSLDISD